MSIAQLGAIHRETVLAETFAAWLADVPMTWLCRESA